MRSSSTVHMVTHSFLTALGVGRALVAAIVLRAVLYQAVVRLIWRTVFFRSWVLIWFALALANKSTAA